jgi:hypothetical protein
MKPRGLMEMWQNMETESATEQLKYVLNMNEEKKWRLTWMVCFLALYNIIFGGISFYIAKWDGLLLALIIEMVAMIIGLYFVKD